MPFHLPCPLLSCCTLPGTVPFHLPCCTLSSTHAFCRLLSRFGGFAGELPASEVLQLLSAEEPALVLDVRPDALREKEGLLQLKLGARCVGHVDGPE